MTYFSVRRSVILLCLVAIPFFVFWKVHSFDFISWDDDYYVYLNPDIRSFTWSHFRDWFLKPHIGLYVPFPLMTFALEHHFFGLAPSAFHVTNLTLHLLNGVLVFFLFQRFFKEDLLCGLATLVFLLHPAQAETVAWISQLKSLLFTLFFLSSFLILTAPFPKNKTFRAGLVFTLFLLALGSRISAVMVPFIFFAFGYFYRGQKRPHMLHFIILALAILTAFFTLQHYEKVPRYILASGWLGFISEQIAIFAAYVQLAFFPADLKLFYPIKNIFFISGIGWAVALTIDLAILALCVYSILKKKTFGFWLLWFGLLILPVTTLAPVPLSGHHLYTALIGLIGLFLMGARRYPFASSFFLIALNLIFGITTFHRLDTWQNSRTYWETALQDAPDHLQVLHQTAFEFLSQGRTNDAIELYEKAVRLYPNGMRLKQHVSLVSAYGLIGAPEKIGDLMHRVELMKNSRSKRAILAYLHAAMEAGNGNMDGAAKWAERAISEGAKAPVLFKYVAVNALSHGEFALAFENLKRAAVLGDKTPDTLMLIGTSLSGMGRWKEAISAFNDILELGFYAPGLYFQTAYAHLKSGEKEQAKHFYILSTKKEPEQAEAYFHLGLLALGENQLNDAKAFFEQALKIDPESERYRNKLGLLANTGSLADAVPN